MPTIEQLLNESRRELLDLSTRNRLLSMPVESKSARMVHVRDEESDEVFRLLVREKKTMAFLSSPEKRGEKKTGDLKRTEDEEAEDFTWLDEAGENDTIDAATGKAGSHVDTRLQTALSQEVLHRRLLTLFRDARTIEEEQGVNILYFALGQLKWNEADQSDTQRFAPLILIPVELKRQSARDRFTLRWREDEPQENLSLEKKLLSDFGIQLPKFPTEEDLVPSIYANEVARAVEGRTGWEVQPNAIALGFFSFAKFLMYRDLDPDNWPEGKKLNQHPSLVALLRDGFSAPDRPFPEHQHLDHLIPVERLDHVVDADSSQTVAIERVRLGENLVIQGPPGTGKSQSISNIIGAAVLDGKRVLFVAEKLAALEVVKRRLEKAGLGAICLELHSHKAHKRAVLEQIRGTWMLGKPRNVGLEELVRRLEETRSKLNLHSETLHTPLQPSGWTPYQIIGRLTALGTRCVEAGTFALAGAEQWTAEGIRQRESLVIEIAERVTEMGPPSSNPWRGVERVAVLAIDLPPLGKQLRLLSERLAILQPAMLKVVATLQVPDPKDFSHIELVRRTILHLASAPPLDREAICHSVWHGDISEIENLVVQGRRYAKARATLEGKVTEEAWEQDSTALRTTLAWYGGAFWSLVFPEYHRSLSALGDLTGAKHPSTITDQLTLLDELIAGQMALRSLRAGDEIAQKALGTVWCRERSDWNQIVSIIDWVREESKVGIDPGVRGMLERMEGNKDAQRDANALSSALDSAWSAASDVRHDLILNVSRAFGAESLDHVSPDFLQTRTQQWIDHLEELSRWCAYEVAAQRARQIDLDPLMDALEQGLLEASTLRDAFDRALSTQLLRELARQQPGLTQFDGGQHNRLVDAFRELDRGRLALARYRALAKHYESLPSKASGVGATGIVLSELERKRGHRPVRKLLADAGSVVQAIKPVFMMSPLSVAQFLAPGSVEFDLLVIDEASQVQPVDAFGAMARTKQIVVVGDSKQLPPTRFFARLTSSDDAASEDEDTLDVAHARDVESILGLCSARGLQQTMLRWHYRSRHHSLIAVSNHEFYDSQLFIVPSPHLVASGLGLKFNYVSDGRFDAGASGTNRIEATRVCHAILEHARNHPEESLGVAAFSVRQQQAILDELERLRRENPDTETFFNAHSHEPFFVKNLENVQGDERDVIFISVGYGKNNDGFLAMRFGPLSSEGGERRLNVLISRSKHRCEVFSSIKAEDIDLARASGRGVKAFKTFLYFAETGRLSLGERTLGEEQSPFEESVRRVVESLGYEVHPQVGVAGFFIDLGVIDPVKPGRYLLGIECDGATYHSSRSARDRDRLRQAVLEDHGWILHRIWSTDWFQRPGEQLRKVGEALERAKVKLAEARTAPNVAKPDNATIERDDKTTDKIDESNIAAAYEQADFPQPHAGEPHNISARQMAEVLHRVVKVEGPVHEDELVVRVRNLWNLGRAGARIQGAVANGIRCLLSERRAVNEFGFISLPDQPIKVRNRESAKSATLRKPEMLPPAEIRQTMLDLVKICHGASERELISKTSRLLGFHAVSSQLRSVMGDQVNALITVGSLKSANGMLVLSE